VQLAGELADRVDVCATDVIPLNGEQQLAFDLRE
jgi:hypothetical protein